MTTLSSPFVVIPLSAFLACFLLHAAALQIFPRIGFVDFPQRYGLTRPPIPYPTGILAVIVFAIVFPVLQPLTAENTALLGGTGILALTCLIDDRLRIPPMFRLAVQVLVAVLLVTAGIRIDAVTNPLPGLMSDAGSLALTSGWALAFSIVFTIVWLLFTINALNWFDGIPGQVSTLSTIAFVTIGFLSLSSRVDQPSLALIAFTLAGISAGVLPFDFPPAKVLMGDTGAMFFGLMIGILTIYSGGKVATAFLVLGVPLVDVLFVIARRLHRGHALWKGNAKDQHLHHRLLSRGWSARQIIALTAIIGTLFGVTALFLTTWGKILAAGILLMLMLGLSWYSGQNNK